MPSRKNRPGKHGAGASTKESTVKLRQIDNGHADRALVDKLITWERERPMNDHYVGWPDMDAAERLVKHGYLREGGLATGCFVVTDAFRRNFMPAQSRL